MLPRKDILCGFKQQSLRRKWGLQEPIRLVFNLEGAKQHEWIQPTWGEISSYYKDINNVIR